LAGSSRIHLPAFLRSTGITPFPRYYERSDCPVALALRTLAGHELQVWAHRALSAYLAPLSHHSVLNHPKPPGAR